MCEDKAEDVVYTLNDEMYENVEMDKIQFEFSSTGYAQAIMFLGHQIWCSENDCREWNEETDEPEDLLTYVRREAIKLIGEIQGALK